jgi:hypothetical protein
MNAKPYLKAGWTGLVAVLALLAGGDVLDDGKLSLKELAVVVSAGAAAATGTFYLPYATTRRNESDTSARY